MNKQDTLKKYQDHMQWSYTDRLGTTYTKVKYFKVQKGYHKDKGDFEYDFLEIQEMPSIFGGDTFQYSFYYLRGKLVITNVYNPYE